MATVSSDSSSITAPRIFHISSSSDSPNVHKCPLCMKFKKYFYCKECIQSGQISSSKSHDQEGYINIRKILEELEENRRIIERSCFKHLEIKQRCDILHTKTRQGKERNRILRLVIEEKRQKRTLQNQKLSELRQRNQEKCEKLKAYKTKSEALGDCVSRKCEDVSAAQEKLNAKHEELKRLARLRIQQLFKYVFPICVVKPSVEMESSGDSMVKELAEASQTTYIRDKWVYTDYSNEIQYSVVAPCLPGSGNYSNYNVWAAQNRDGIPISEETELVEVNPAFSISAALTYTAQLVNVLSFFLNVRLPYKMVYSEFSSNTINEEQFARRVARLNANILYLCISQNVDLSSLCPNGTIHNILQLKENETADLGRQGPIEVNDLQVTALEKSISSDLKSSDDSDSDEGDSFTVEWEAVPHVQCPEVQAGPGTVQSTQMLNTQQASSMAGGLMNSAVASVASIWRGFTGR